MAGLLIKELIARGDVQKCLIVCPGNLVEQWQDELDRRFHLPFEIMTNDKLESARTGNWFIENPLAVWDNGRFKQGHRQFQKVIKHRMPPSQQPNYSVVGSPNKAFEQQRPFGIDTAVEAARS